MGRVSYLGIDLGTTNSAACLFDGEQLHSTRTSNGDTLTPSVVRIDRKGAVSVGARALKAGGRDPENTHREFKRLMGSSRTLDFPAAGLVKRPEELAAEVLASLRKDVEAQAGYAPEQAVIAVPALFELPQIRATSEAARLAGFSRVETVQEPVASALASGWSAEESRGSWLVYDLGGGTFDVSLLDSREGLLRVVGHDGDNFLGGRDFDVVIAQVLAGLLERETGFVVNRANPEHALAFSRLKALAEEAKIEASRSSSDVEVLLDGFSVGTDPVEMVEVSLQQADIDRACLPLIDRTVQVCERLLREHATRGLERIVLVGGPTVMPQLRRRLQEKLNVRFEVGLDPMTLVSQGAALFAATSGLGASKTTRLVSGTGPKLWLQYPAMTPDLSPFVVGRSLDESNNIEAVRFTATDGHDFDSGWSPLDPDGTFSATLLLKRRAANSFHVMARVKDGAELTPSPDEISIVHGVSVGDPPLPRSIGVAKVDDTVALYFERGTPLPCKRTFTHRTVERVDNRAHGYALRIPIVQGDFPFAHLCRLVGVIEIAADSLTAPMPASTLLELTIEVDRGGALSARATIPSQKLVFEHVESLVAPEVSIEQMEQLLKEQRDRGNELRVRGFHSRDALVVTMLGNFEALHSDLKQEIDAARGGELDAGEKARRALIDADGLLGDVEARLAWPDLSEEAFESHAVASYLVEAYGSEAERLALKASGAAIERGLRNQNPKEIERQLRNLRMIRSTCYLRSPNAWVEQLDYYSSRISEATDPRVAQRLVTRGRKAEEKNNKQGLENAVRELWALFPHDEKRRVLGFDSSVK